MNENVTFEAVDKTLHDIRQSNGLFGGCSILICGGLRQILPVIPNDSIAEEIGASIKNSYLRDNILKYQLKTNMVFIQLILLVIFNLQVKLLN